MGRSLSIFRSASLALLLAFISLPANISQPANAKAKYNVVTFTFPDEPGLGVLQAEGGNNVEKDSLSTTGAGTTNLAPARGKVLLKVTPGRNIVLSVGPHLVDNPQLLAGIDPTNIFDIKMRVNTFDASEEGKADRFLLKIGHFKNLKSITLMGSDVSNRGILRLNSLPALKYLSLHSTLADAKAVPFIATLKSLEQLDMSELSLAGADFAPLTKLPKLTIFAANRSSIGDSELKTLVGCKVVSSLFLSMNAKITDASASTLASMPSVHYVDLVGTSVTAAALPRLRHIGMVLLDESAFPGQSAAQVHKRFPNVWVESRGGKRRKPSEDELRMFAPTRY